MRENLKKIIHLQDLSVDGRIILKYLKQNDRAYSEYINLLQKQVANYYKYSYEFSGFIKCWEFLR